MKSKTYWLLMLIPFVVLSLLLNLTTFLTYNIDKDNCENLLKIQYSIPTDNIADCISLINHPIYAYYVPEIGAGWFISAFFVFIAGLIIWIILDYNDKFTY